MKIEMYLQTAKEILGEVIKNRFIMKVLKNLLLEILKIWKLKNVKFQK